jgi:hypothetical protein
MTGENSPGMWLAVNAGFCVSVNLAGHHILVASRYNKEEFFHHICIARCLHNDAGPI